MSQSKKKAQVKPVPVYLWVGKKGQTLKHVPARDLTDFDLHNLPDTARDRVFLSPLYERIESETRPAVKTAPNKENK